MVSKLNCLGYLGLDVFRVEVEVDVQRGLPSLSLIGLLDTPAKESKERVRSAIKNSGYKFPSSRITVNLAPANVKKEGTHFDLAIALGILKSSHQLNCDFSQFFILGELSLEGKVRGIKGVFPMALKAKEERKKLIVPKDNAYEASLVKDIEVYPVSSLEEVVAFLSGTIEIKRLGIKNEEIFDERSCYGVDFSEVKGQIFAKRALEVAVSGMHNVIMIGPPGVGKSMLAQRVPTILPSMEFEEILEVTKIYSIAGLLSQEKPLMKERPFRNPHHTSSSVALVGGGTSVKPGEITLAHNGVLFLDELPEFSRDALEALRQPLEDGFVSISRATKHIKFPSRFLLIAAMNPCPCGYFNSKKKVCRCSSYQIQRYRNKVSGPLLDRIDIHIELQDLDVETLFSDKDMAQETSSQIRKRVEKARQIQRKRFEKEKVFFNSQMNHRQIRKYCVLSKEAKDLLRQATTQFNFSARAYDKILKVSRTIADLAEEEMINSQHIAEAVHYRSLDKNLWF